MHHTLISNSKGIRNGKKHWEKTCRPVTVFADTLPLYRFYILEMLHTPVHIYEKKYTPTIYTLKKMSDCADSLQTWSSLVPARLHYYSTL